MQINYKRTTFILLTVIASLLVTIGALAGNPSAPANAAKGNALDFDGVDDYVALNGAFGGVAEVTIEAWIKMDAGGAVVSPPDQTFVHFQFYNPGTVIAVYTTEGSFLLDPSSDPTVGEWEHWALSISGIDGNYLYRNGQLVASNSTQFGTIVPTSALQIGRGYDDGGTYRNFNGQIDEVRIWDTARTQAEIQADMYTELAGTEAFLRAYYQMEDGLGADPSVTTLTDITSFGHNGTLVNMDGDIDWAGHLWHSGGLTGSNGGLTLTDVSFLNDNGDHIDFAHDGGSGTTTADLPGVDFKERWGRAWTCNVQDSGGVGGNIQLVFQSSGGVTESTGKYRLLRRDGASGAFTDVQGADSVDTSADTITFDSVSAAGLCSQITIGVLSNLDSPSTPADSASQMYTLEQIYGRLTTGAAGAKMTAFTEPAAGPGAGTMHTLDEIMAAAPSVDDTNGASAAGVFSGQTFWGLTSGAWGPHQSGALNVACNTATFDGNANLAANAYDGSGNGTDRWCMTDSGYAAAGDIATGKTAWIDGSEVTGDLHGGCTCAGTLNGTRWCDNGDGTVTDLLGFNGAGKCLVWAQDASWGGTRYWTNPSGYDDAHTRASAFGTDSENWRLPTMAELYALTQGTEPVNRYTPRTFTGVLSRSCWSSTSDTSNISRAYSVYLDDGVMTAIVKDTTLLNVWPVRDGGQ